MSCLASLAYAESSPGCKAAKPFYDALLFRGKPSSSELGLGEISLIYEGRLFPKGAEHTQAPTETQIDFALQGSTAHVIVLDIESLPLTGDQEVVTRNLRILEEIIGLVRRKSPSKQIGLYGILPLRDYWRAIGKDRSKYSEWQKENDRIAPLAAKVDILFPSIYTFYPDPEGWKKYATAQIEEAKRIGKGKPVLPFMWPKYHDSNKALAGKYLPADVWGAEVALAQKSADGIVLWGGFGEPWDAGAPWWSVIKKACAQS